MKAAIAAIALLVGCMSVQAPVLKPQSYDLIVTIPDQNGDGVSDILIVASRGHGTGGWVENQIRNCLKPLITSVAVVAGGTNTDDLLVRVEWCADTQPRRVGIARLADGTEMFFIEDDRMHLVSGVKITAAEFEQLVRPQLRGPDVK
jgi:hypothetical protein